MIIQRGNSRNLNPLLNGGRKIPTNPFHPPQHPRHPNRVLPKKPTTPTPQPVYAKMGEIKKVDLPKPKTIPYHDTESFHSINVNVVQGLGDIFWSYQKLSPYFNEINVNILITGMDEVQRRSYEWMKIFPKIKLTNMKTVTGDEYGNVAQSWPNIKDVISAAKNSRTPNYCPNRWLETGTRLEHIDPGSLLERTIPLKSEPYPLPFDKYISIGISGSTDHENNQNNPGLQVWSVPKWLEYIQRLYDKYSLNYPAYIIGANFDKIVCNKIAEALDKKGVKTAELIGEHPLKVMHALKSANFMIGYQSGLNIVSENFDVPQIMINFVYLKPMIYSWCKNESISTIFHATTFDRSPTQVINDHDVNHAFQVAAKRNT